MKTLLFVALAALLSGAPVSAQDLTRNRVEADIRFLADDLLGGRGTPSEGLEIAAKYLAGELYKAGWAPANGASFMQPYSLASYEGSAATYTLHIDGVEIPKEQFVFAPVSADPTVAIEGKTVFLGRAIDYPEKGIRDYAGADVKDKIVVAFTGAPWKAEPGPFGPEKVIGKIIAATSRGAKLLVLVTPDLGDKTSGVEMAKAIGGGTVAYLPDSGGSVPSGLGSSLVIPASVFDKFFAKPSGRTFAEWQKYLEKKQARKEMPTTMRVDIAVKPDVTTPANVVAKLEGSDPQLRDEWVVLTAHYDHLGTVTGADGRKVVMNGADDNASGTAAIVEVARELAAGPRPKRSVLVVLCSGEERGLLGSAAYAMRPIVPYEKVVANINVDMVGRSDGSVQAITQSPQLFKLASDLGARESIKVLPDQQVSWRVPYLTDSYHFSRFNIPSVEFFTGLHEDYHAAGDDADKIHFAELARIMTVMHGVARLYADGAPRATVERPEWYVTP